MGMTLQELLELVGDNEELRVKILAKQKQGPKFKVGDEVWTVRFELVKDRLGELTRVIDKVTITKVNKGAKRIRYNISDRMNDVDEYYLRATEQEALELLAELE